MRIVRSGYREALWRERHTRFSVLCAEGVCCPTESSNGARMKVVKFETAGVAIAALTKTLDPHAAP